MSGFPFEGVDRRANKRFVINLFLPRDTQLRRVEWRKGNEQRCRRRVPLKKELAEERQERGRVGGRTAVLKREGNGQHCRRRGPA
jgi:hypothetical protein